MNLVPAGKSLSFEVTYDSALLNVAMSVYDDSGNSPVLVQGPLKMEVIVANTYRGRFVPSAAKPYVIFKAVYTDDTYTTLHPDYSQGSESIRAEDFAALVLNPLIADYQLHGSVGAAIAKCSESAATDLLGTVDPDSDISASVDDGDDELSGTVEEEGDVSC